MVIRSVHQRIVLAIVLVGCVPLLIGLVLAYMSGMRSLRDVIGGNFRAIADQAAERVAMLVQGEIQGVKLLASAPLRVRLPVVVANRSYPSDASMLIQERIREWDNGTEFSERLLNSELSRFLLETKVRDGDKVVGLLITDQYGALVAASSEPDRYFFGGEPWWQTIHDERSGYIYLSDVIAGKAGSFRTPEETIDIAVPILDDHQRTVIGAIKASYRFDTLFALINQIRIGQTGHAMLFDSAGQPLVCPILPRQAHRIHEQLMRLIVSAEPGWGIAEDDAHGASETVVGFAPVRGVSPLGKSWHVFVRQHPSESYAPIREQMRNLALIALVMVVLLAIMGRYVASRIARPIRALRRSVADIGRGSYDVPLDIRTGDEFDALAQDIRRMAESLKISRAELEALNRDLARRVEEKTAEATKHMRQLKMSERLATMGKVASGIAHEVNNPLGIILNRIECLEAEAAQVRLPDWLAKDLTAIKTQAERIQRVTRSVLTLSRGATTLKPIDLNCVVRTCLAVAGERATAQRVRLGSELATDLPPVMGDRDRLETVVLNLVNNAIDAVQRSGGEEHVTVRSLTVKGHDGDWVEIQVQDSGPGVPEEVRERIFDPFFTTKPAGQGTGLGLFLSYSIVSDHRGRLEIRPSPSGALFVVSLPALAEIGETTREKRWHFPARS